MQKPTAANPMQALCELGFIVASCPPLPFQETASHWQAGVTPASRLVGWKVVVTWDTRGGGVELEALGRAEPLRQWFSTFLMPRPFNTVPHVVVTPNHKII
ncbi:UNVERIFIED_CONTAM: hypothetical protein K2H54_004607 [Gekko kuhli]